MANSRPASKEEVIHAFLKREIEPQWELIQKVLEVYFPDSRLTKEQARALIDKPDFENEQDNNFRLRLLWYRRPLLDPIFLANWSQRILLEKEFEDLNVIRDNNGWNEFSRNTGKLREVAKLIHENKTSAFSIAGLEDIARKVSGITKQGILDKNLILLQSGDSSCTTILEGNKTAVALYIKYFLEDVQCYEPFSVYVGFLEKRSYWQW